MIDICDDSAQSAPPNFTFDTDSLIREVESESRDTNQDLSGDLERVLTQLPAILRNHYVIKWYLQIKFEIIKPLKSCNKRVKP